MISHQYIGRSIVKLYFNGDREITGTTDQYFNKHNNRNSEYWNHFNMIPDDDFIILSLPRVPYGTML